MIWLETCGPTLVRRIGIKLWPTTINCHQAIVWWLCSSTALETLEISKLISAPRETVHSFKEQLVQDSSAAHEKSDFAVPMCLGWPALYGEKFCRTGSAAAIGWLGWECRRRCSSPWSPCSLFTCLPVPSLGGQHSDVEKNACFSHPSKPLPVEVVCFVHALTILL